MEDEEDYGGRRGRRGRGTGGVVRVVKEEARVIYGGGMGFIVEGGEEEDARKTR